MEHVEYPAMSGSNTICVATVLIETGMVEVTEPVTEFTLEAPAGLIRIRATVQNRHLAESAGISTRRTDMLTFFLGSGLAGIAGVALTLMGSISSNLGTSYIVDAFLVVIIGGIGQIKGAVIAAFVLGVAQSWIEYSTSASIAKVIVFALVVAFLQFRPQGIFQVRTRSLV